MKLIIIYVMIVSATMAGSLTTYSFTGSLDNPDDVFLQEFTVLTTSDITVQTWGYGGGTNAAGQAIPAGGFDPLVAIFDPSDAFVDQNDDGSCPPGNVYYYTCFDSTLVIPETPPGTYTLALTVSPNEPAGLTLQDGFTGGGDFYGLTPNYAVDISVQSDTSIPEPRTLWLCLGSITFIWYIYFKRRKPIWPYITSV